MTPTTDSIDGLVQTMVQPVTDLIEQAVAREANWNQLLNYWCDLTQEFTFNPQDFYALVAKHLETHKVPGLETHQVLMRESGRFSAKRLYLQFRRERLVFEICGFPFGTGFFVSSRLFDRRRKASWADFLLLFFLLAVLTAPFGYQYGWYWGLLGIVGALALIWALMLLAAANIIPGLDRVLSDVPLLGLLYDHIFHADTFYRQDTNNAYRLAVESAVRGAINEMRAEKGLKPIADGEWRPVMRDLLQPVKK
jgi:hypothetical protein